MEAAAVFPSLTPATFPCLPNNGSRWRRRQCSLLTPRRCFPAFPTTGVDGGGGSVPFSPHGDVSLPSQQREVSSRRRPCSLLPPRRRFPAFPRAGVDGGAWRSQAPPSTPVVGSAEARLRAARVRSSKGKGLVMGW